MLKPFPILHSFTYTAASDFSSDPPTRTTQGGTIYPEGTITSPVPSPSVTPATTMTDPVSSSLGATATVIVVVIVVVVIAVATPA